MGFTCSLSAKVWMLGVIDRIQSQGKAPYGVGQHCFLDSIALMCCAEDIAQVQDLQPFKDACRASQISNQPLTSNWRQDSLRSPARDIFMKSLRSTTHIKLAALQRRPVRTGVQPVTECHLIQRKMSWLHYECCLGLPESESSRRMFLGIPSCMYVPASLVQLSAMKRWRHTTAQSKSGNSPCRFSGLRLRLLAMLSRSCLGTLHTRCHRAC